MTRFDPGLHPRARTGQFQATVHPESEVTLEPDATAIAALREKADGAAAQTDAGKALAQARAAFMHMSDDPRVAARYDAIETAAHTAAQATPEARAYRSAVADAARARAAAAPVSEPVRHAVPVSPGRTPLRQNLRNLPPQEVIAGMSDVALRVTLNALRRERPTRHGNERITLIENEMSTRTSAS